MTKVKLRCGECGSEGEFPAHDPSSHWTLVHEQNLALLAAWAKVHAPCLESVVQRNGDEDSRMIEAAMAEERRLIAEACAGCVADAAGGGCVPHSEQCGMPTAYLERNGGSPDPPAPPQHVCICSRPKAGDNGECRACYNERR